jgi:hypothetical protein
MITLTEKDVQILDAMLVTLLKDGRIHSARVNLLESLQERKSRFAPTKADQYSRYMEILGTERIAACTSSSGEFNCIVNLPKAQEFHDQGGFKKVYEDQQKEQIRKQEISNLELSKLRSDAKLSKWQVKTFWWFFFVAIVGSILGAIAFFIQVF